MTLTHADLPVGSKVRFNHSSAYMKKNIPKGTVGEVIRWDTNPSFFTAKYKWLTDDGYTHQEYRHRFDKEGVSWEQMLTPKVGDIVESIQSLDTGHNPPLRVPPGTRGVVSHVFDSTRSCSVVYDWRDVNGCPRTAPYTHAISFHGNTWRIVGHSAQTPTHSMTIESEKEINLFIAQSTETIDGWVPQVKYGDVIVWQGDPVSSTDKDGEALSSNQQSSNAIGAAGDKITEVVKKQFA